jgi:parvulin-like peptidyl-prolyl isomerase
MHTKCVAALFALTAGITCLAADIKVIEQIVAKVNGEIITQGDLAKARKDAEAELARQQVSPVRAKELMQKAEANFLRDKIDQLLLVQKAKELEIDVDSDVSKRLAEIQVQSKIADADKFHEYIREETGLSFEDFKQQMQNSMLTKNVVQREVGSRITVSKAEQLKYYEAHKSEFIREEQVVLSEILISTEGKDEKGAAAAEKKAKELSTRARKGENFGTLAHDNSDAETAQDNGELPVPYKRGMLKKEIEDVVFKQDQGYVTDPFKQPNGFLILKVDEHYKQGLQAFDAVQDEVMDKLFRPRMEPAVREYLTKLRKEAFLEIRAGYADSGAAPGKDTSWRDPAKLKPQTITKEEVAMRPRSRHFLGIPIPFTKKVRVKPGQSAAAPAAPSAPAARSAVPPATPGAAPSAAIPSSALPAPTSP